MIKTRSAGNITFRAGLVGGILLMIVHLVMLLIFQGSMIGTLFGWLIACFVYYSAGRSAAQQVYNQLRDGGGYSQSVRSAGIGAAVISSLLVWLFLLALNVIRDAQGYQVFIDPRLLCVALVVDIGVAAGLGTLGSRSVLRMKID